MPEKKFPLTLPQQNQHANTIFQQVLQTPYALLKLDTNIEWVKFFA